MTEIFSTNRIEKIFSIISIGFIVLELLIISFSGTAKGYEISIYNAYPSFFWLIVIASMCFPFVSMTYHSIFCKNSKKVNINFQLIGATITLLLLFLLPYFRGYLFYSGGDLLSHIGYTKDLMNGIIPEGNVYPGAHILFAIISYFTGLTLYDFSFLILPVFILLFISSMYILTKSLNFSNIALNYIIILTLIPIFGMELTREYVFPTFEAFCFLPLIFFLFFKSLDNMKQINYAFLLILFLILIPFFHIEVTSFLIIILFGVYLLSYVYNLFKSQIDGAESFHLNSPLPLFILLITFFLWFTALKIFDNITLMIYKVFAYGSDFGLGDSPFQITTYAMDKTSLNLFEIFWLILKTWGVIIVFFGVTTIISLSIIIKYKQFIKNKVILLLFAFIFLLLCCLSGILFFKDSVFGLSLRYAKYAVLFGMIIVGYYCINIYFTKKTVLKVISLIIFVLFVSFAVLNLFPSPWINLPNKQITRESFEGSRFFLSYFDQSIGFYEMNTKLSVYYQAFNGVNQFKQQNVVVESVMVSPPAHFGYSRSSTLGKTINANSYLIYNEIAKIYFPSVYPKYPESWAFSPSDFVKLEYDPSVDHIYTNSEIEIYTITT